MIHSQTPITRTTTSTYKIFWAPWDPKNLPTKELLRIKAKKSRICEWILEWYINIPTSSAEMDAIRHLSNAFIGGMIKYPLTLNEKNYLNSVLLAIQEQRISIPKNNWQPTTIQTMFGKTLGALTLEELLSMTPEEEANIF